MRGSGERIPPQKQQQKKMVRVEGFEPFKASQPAVLKTAVYTVPPHSH
jgi:hypothetical protein